MKNIFTLLTVCFGVYFPSMASAQTGYADRFDLKDKEDLIIRLFDADSINPAGELLWEPLTFSDQIGSNISDDGFVHTAFDTILYFTVGAVNQAVAVFQTYHYLNGQINACQECGAQVSAAIFEDAGDGQWQILKFMKHFTTSGTYGLNGQVGLTQFGDEIWCLRLEMGWVGQGIYGEYLSYFEVETFQRIFQFTLHEDNTAAFDFPDPERTYAFDKSIHFLPHVDTASGWWDFDLVTRGTEKDDDIDRAVPANYVTRFIYDWDTGHYVKACP